MAIFDFNSNVLFGHILSIPAWKGVTDVFGANCFLPTHGLSAQTRIQQVCPEVPGQLPSSKIFLLHSISLYGLRSADLPRKSPRDRNMFACLGSPNSITQGFGAKSLEVPSPKPTKTETGESTPIFAHVLIQKARNLYAQDDFGVVLDQAAYVFDSTTIDLCLSLFPWAHFRKRKGAIKLHTLMDLHGSIPCFIRVTEGNIHDVNLLDH